MNEVQIAGKTYTFIEDKRTVFDLIDDNEKLKRENHELRILVAELRTFKNSIIQLRDLSLGSVSLCCLVSTYSHKWVVTRQENLRRVKISKYCATPDEAIRQALEGPR